MLYRNLHLQLFLNLFANGLLQSAPSFQTRSNLALARLSSSSKNAIEWFTREPLESLLPQDDAESIIEEILSNDELLSDSEEAMTRNWNSFERRLRNETRSIRDIIGVGTTDRVLHSVEDMEGYDPDAVRAFLGSDAINSLFAKVLYDGIFEFFQKIDVFGNVVNSLPIIGPIRRQIVAETKRSLDKTLGPLVQNFLGTYTKIAVRQAIDFVLSPNNRKSFGGANVRLLSSILERPVNTLIPPEQTSEILQNDLFTYLRKSNTTEINRYLSFVYDIAGEKSIDKVVDVDRLLEASPTLQTTVDRIWESLNEKDSS